MNLTGKTIRYGDDISTDLIYPGRYTYQLLTEEEMGRHALEDLDPQFAARDVSGMFLVVGHNFGCGSAREQAVKCLKSKGIRAVIAESISRIYYRNCINEGLLPIICPQAVEAIKASEAEEEITIDAENAVIHTAKGTFSFAKYPPFVMDILSCGGLIPSVRLEVAKAKEKL